MKRVNNKDKYNILTGMVKRESKKVTLTKEQILGLVKRQNDPKDVKILLPTSNMHPTAEQRKDIKHVSKEEFTRRIVRCGSSGHIGVSKHWVDKFVKVTMEEVKE